MISVMSMNWSFPGWVSAKPHFSGEFWTLLALGDAPVELVDRLGNVEFHPVNERVIRDG